jgi:signal transduction histidine kinase
MVDNLRAMIDKMGRQQKLSALGQLAGTVGHDLRNPLAALGATLHTLRQTSESKGFGIERALDRMGRSVERCNAIVSDLLDFTRTPDLKREATGLDGWLGELLDEHKLTNGVALRREFAIGVEALIDRDRFQRVMINLIDNAAQAMTVQGWTPPDDRVPTITVRAEAAGPHVRLAVADNGPGINSESLPRIFEPLFTTKSSGVGLGLPIVRQIVEQHGGTIDVESRVDVGTTFTIFLPRHLGARQSAPAIAATEHAAA